MRMEAFGLVVIVASLAGALVAIVAYVGTGKLYGGIGRGGLSLDRDDDDAPRAGSEQLRREAEAELRQLLEAKSYLRQERGEPPLDVEAELRALAGAPPAADPELVEEVRQLVIAGNERRARRGEPPLDVEAEVARRLRELGA